eukprot:gene7168-14598_t
MLVSKGLLQRQPLLCRPIISIERNSSQTIPPSKPTFHKRPLPKSLIALSSPQGKALFKEALASGYMESFFPLSEQFITQSDPSFCSLSSLAMVLNALNHDPKKIWKGVWRWISEETLQCETTEICGHSLDKIKKDGVHFDEFEHIARCHGVRIHSYRAGNALHSEYCKENLELFRLHTKESCRKDTADQFIVVNFSRKSIAQTGDGHFSPIGGYHAEKDLVLIMDVARFKYPPFWVPLTDLWQSMSFHDKTTGIPRGYFIISSWKSNLYDNENEKDIISNSTSSSSSSSLSQQQQVDVVSLQSCPPVVRSW